MSKIAAPRTATLFLLTSAMLMVSASSSRADPTRVSDDISIRHVVDTGNRASLRIELDPVTDDLYYLRTSGSIYRLHLEDGAASPERIFRSGDTGMPAPRGFAIGPDGTFWLVGNQSSGDTTVLTIRRGTRVSPEGESRQWTTVARTEPYPLAGSIFNHLAGGIAVSPDGVFVYASSGSRTDHGEVDTRNGAFPGLREAPLTSIILRVRTERSDRVLMNDRDLLWSRENLYAEGVRNIYDMAFDAEGLLFGVENSGDRSDSDELNQLRLGGHYGFPWRMGDNDTPQQFPDYDPNEDPVIDRDYWAWNNGLFRNDPDYPAPPQGIRFSSPVRNIGPHADKFKDPETGEIRDASELGVSIGTFTGHRSPVGLVFDTSRQLGGSYTGDAFVLGWTAGNPVDDGGSGPFADPGEDLLHMEISRTQPLETEFMARVTRIARGFENPIDAAQRGHRLYVLEHGGDGGIWEITFPEAPALPSLRRGYVNDDALLDLSDGVLILLYLFAQGSIACLDAADVNDDGGLDVTDAVFLLGHLFIGGVAPAEPFAACGEDGTPDDAGDLGCQVSSVCP